MNPQSKTDSDAILKQTQDLLKRDPIWWKPAWHQQVRWWNIAMGVLILLGIASIGVPLRNPALRQDFWGNIVAEMWGLIASAVVAWVAFKRFKAERYAKAVPVDWNKAFGIMREIALNLYPSCLGEPSEMRSALNNEVRIKLRQAAGEGFRKCALYGRFLEIEQIADIERCCESAESLAGIDQNLQDSQFMERSIREISSLYVWSSSAAGTISSINIVESLHNARKRWSSN